MKKITSFIILSISFLSANIAKGANKAVENLEKLQEPSGFTGQASEYAMAEFIGKIIQTFFSLLGIIFIILVIYAGYNWMMAQGDEKKVTDSKHTIQRAIIGLIITVGSYGIWNLIAAKLLGLN